jgi:hypothetical protein
MARLTQQEDPFPEPIIPEPPIPEPDGDFILVSPLSSQVKTLMGLGLTGASDTPRDAQHVLWRLLNEGTVLFRAFTKYVIKISPTIVVKFSPCLDICEIQTMYQIWPNRGIPMPETLGAVSIGRFKYIFMSYIEGVTLASLWPSLTPDLKTSVQLQLGEILECLRKMPLPSKYLGSGDPPCCKDLRRHLRSSSPYISNEADFNKFLASTDRQLNPVYLELCTSQLGTGHQIVMTHSDLHPRNIMVVQKTPNTIKITGLVDWEVSGAYPEYWEYVKAHSDVNWDKSDWLSYLPTAVIGIHGDAWRHDTFINRLVL